MEKQMDKHITMVSVLHIGLSLLGILIAIIVVLSTVGPGVLVLILEGDAEPLAILTIIGFAVGIIMLVLAVPGIIGGIGLLKRKPWARYLVLILAVLDLFNIPIGTAIGVYTFWVLVQEEVVQMFTPSLEADA